MTPKVESTVSKLPSSNGSRSASPSTVSSARPSGRASLGARAFLGAAQELRYVVEPRDVAKAARGRQRRVTVATGDVEHARPRLDVRGLPQRLTDDLQRRTDDREVPRSPHGLLAGLHRRKVDFVRSSRL